jgi:signal transduction histidine kinase
MVSAALSLAGWAAAGLAAAVAVGVRRTYGDRMEAVARACHELRGPLTAARLGLASGSGRAQPSARRLRAIDIELERAALALDDLAGAGGGHGRRWDLDRIEIPALVADSVEAWRAAAESSGIAVWADRSGEEGAAVWGDRVRLAQALGNLIANAVEHGRGPVTVHSTTRRGHVRISVSDRGRGLPAPVADLRRRPRRGRGARGRGLAIAAEVAEAHGGRLISAPSQVGACLVLELPVARQR